MTQDMAPSEVKALLKHIFSVQPACITRAYYRENVSEGINTEAEALRVCPPTLMLWGPPGIGKSRIVYEAAREANISEENFMDIRLATLEPVDLRGVPSVEFGRTIYNPPSFFPSGTNEIDEAEKVLPKLEESIKSVPSHRELIETNLISKYRHILENADKQKTGVLFFDELTSAPTDIQIAAYEIILDRKIGQYKLPITWSIVAAGNRVGEVNAAARELPIPLSNRMLHISVKNNRDDWAIWAQENRLSPAVIGFGYTELTKDEKDLQTRGYGAGEKGEGRMPAFLSPRSLEWLDYVDKQIDSGLMDIYNLPEDSNRKRDLELALYRSAIGTGEAALYGFWKTSQRFLLTGREMYDNPKDTTKYYKIIKNGIAKLTPDDIKELGQIKAKLSNARDATVVINDYMNNYSNTLQEYSGPITNTFYPNYLLEMEAVERIRHGTHDDEKFLAAAKGLAENLGNIAQLGIIEGLADTFLKSVPKDKLAEAARTKAAWRRITNEIRH